jgi:hypothetical protein
MGFGLSAIAVAVLRGVSGALKGVRDVALGGGEQHLVADGSGVGVGGCFAGHLVELFEAEAFLGCGRGGFWFGSLGLAADELVDLKSYALSHQLKYKLYVRQTRTLQIVIEKDQL